MQNQAEQPMGSVQPLLLSTTLSAASATGLTTAAAAAGTATAATSVPENLFVLTSAQKAMADNLTKETAALEKQASELDALVKKLTSELRTTRNALITKQRALKDILRPADKDLEQLVHEKLPKVAIECIINKEKKTIEVRLWQCEPEEFEKANKFFASFLQKFKIEQTKGGRQDIIRVIIDGADREKIIAGLKETNPEPNICSSGQNW